MVGGIRKVRFSRCRNAKELGSYDHRRKTIYIYLVPHLKEARNIDDLIGLLNDTFIHELLHSMLPKVGERRIDFGMVLLHKALGDFC
jgi:hypothetical protein